MSAIPVKFDVGHLLGDEEDLFLRREESHHPHQSLTVFRRQERPDHICPEIRKLQAGERMRPGEHIGVDADVLLSLHAAQQGQEVGAEVCGGPGAQVLQGSGCVEADGVNVDVHRRDADERTRCLPPSPVHALRVALGRRGDGCHAPRSASDRVLAVVMGRSDAGHACTSKRVENDPPGPPLQPKTCGWR